MSGASQTPSNVPTTKATTNDTNQTPSSTSQPQPTKQLEEDDEFEDFPVEDWPDEETDLANNGGSGEANSHLWEESWDDDDQSEDFANLLKEELKKVDTWEKR